MSSRATPRPPSSHRHPPGHARSSCHLPTESENELFTYLRYVNGNSVMPRSESMVEEEEEEEEELRRRGPGPNRIAKLAQGDDNRWTSLGFPGCR